MNILYCGDSNIADGVIISVLSLLRNINEPLNIYILTANIENETRKFNKLSKEFGDYLNNFIKAKNEQNSVTVIDITDKVKKQLPVANMNTRFTPCCMLRLYADLVDDLPEKILYLDNDVLCRKDFSEIYNSDVSDYEFMGVLDHYGRWFFHNRFFLFDYINSGVLLLNLKKIRETGLFVKCRQRCAETKMFMPDQSAINKLAVRKKILNKKYNEQRKLRKKTVLQHFTTSFRFFPFIHTVTIKPWDIERVHNVLKLYEYDDILSEYENLKKELKNF